MYNPCQSCATNRDDIYYDKNGNIQSACDDCYVKSGNLSHDVVVNGACMVCGEELKSDEGLFLCKRCKKVMHIIQSKKCWHKMNWEDTSELKDHYYYLVTHTDYGTPMKAKWHNEAGGCFEVIGVPKSLHEYDVEFVWSYESEDHNPIIAWMEMPDIYKES